MEWLDNIEQFNRRRKVRNLITTRLLDDDPITQKTIESFSALITEGIIEEMQLPQLLLPQSKMIPGSLACGSCFSLWFVRNRSSNNG